MTESTETRFSHQTIGPLQVWWGPQPVRTLGEHIARPLLATWFQCAPEALPLARDQRGRPQLTAHLATHDANWSHSGNHLLLATGEGIHLGVDVEYLRPRPRALELAERYFAPSETQALRALPKAQQSGAFLRLWCAKEALLKAHGHGISFGLQHAVFAPVDGLEALGSAPLQLIDCDPRLGAPDDWALHQWQPQPDYLAAVAWRAAPSLR